MAREQAPAVSGHCLQLPVFEEAESQNTEKERIACLAASDALARAQWWMNIYKEEMTMNAAVSHKLVLLLRIIDACSDVGDKLVIFSSSLMALELIELFLKKGHSKWPFTPRCTEHGEQ